MVERRIYDAPPIREAVCEIRCDGSSPWSLDRQVAVARRASEQYDSEPDLRFQSGLGVESSGGPIDVRLQDPSPQLWFTDSPGTRRLTVTPTGFSVHVFRPYKRWEEFRPLIAHGMDLYDEVFTPTGMSRIGLRYINEIALPVVDFEVGRYLLGAPSFGQGVEGLTTVNVLCRTESVHKDPGTRVVQTAARIPTSKDGMMGLLLDIDVMRSWDVELAPITTVLETVERLKELEREVFETSITDELRGYFYE